MNCRERSKTAGDVFPVRDSYHYPLPRGLAGGTVVKLMAYDRGYWTVETAGEVYSVFATLVDAGFEYKLNGRWLPECDPRVQAMRAATTLANSPAFSCVSGGCVAFPKMNG